ncbi:MAG TPA: hypothetical protein VFX50_06605 [Gemmatimonadales bacterium]|nr:hypothetical protein [Gemmatimonadales bacterium]
MNELLARLAELDAANRDRPAPEPLVVRWWDVPKLTRTHLTPRTPVAIGPRTVSVGEDGSLVVQGRIRLGPETGKDLPALQAAASLAAEWFEDGVPPFVHPGRVATVIEEPPETIHLVLRCGLPEVAGVQDAFGTLYELERAMVQALGVSPGAMGRPPWT